MSRTSARFVEGGGAGLTPPPLPRRPPLQHYVRSMTIDPETCTVRTMTLVIPLGFASVIHSIIQSGDNEPMAMTYGVDADDTATADGIAGACATAFIEIMAEVMSNQFTLVSTEVTFQGVPNDPPTVGTSTTTATGNGTDPIMPQNNAYLIHKRTQFGGRTGRGRMFQPGVSEGAVNTVGQLTTAQKNALTVSYQDFLSDLQLSAPIVNMVILHDSLGAGALLPPRAVTSLGADAVISTQRRRLRR